MDFNLKTYKYFRIKNHFKTIKFFFFFHGTSLNNESWIKIEQILVSHELQYFRILNKLMINILKNSIFKNVITIIHGPIILLNSSNNELTFRELEDISPLIDLLGFKLNNKVYSKKQIKSLTRMSYLENFYGFHNSIKGLTKMPYYKLKSEKVLQISE